MQNHEEDDDYHRDSFVDVEDQVETSKLVLQLVTESRFNMTQINGQRKLGGPPPGWQGPAPGPGCEVFVGKIPRTLYEHEIYPIFREMGEVYEIRLMMDFSGTNRGYCFVMFGRPEFAQRAIRELDNFEIRPGRRIGVVASINNCRLYIGQLPAHVTSESVIRKIYDITDDVGQVSVYRNANDQAKYALISYRTHRGAAMARRRLVPERASLFGGVEVSIDWAHPSMFPSNVVEDTGTCDDQGNVEMSRLVVGNENKRCQNRRRSRDDFLDHNIRAYIQADRVLEQSSRGKENFDNRSSSHSIDSVGRDLINLHLLDQNKKNYRHRFYPRSDKINSGESSSSFDANGESGSSESSACSSRSSDPSTTTYAASQIYYPVGNEDQRSVGTTDPYSLNLFDNYTFSGNSQDLNDVQARDVFFNGFENQDQVDGEKDRKLRPKRKNKGDFNFQQVSKPSSFRELESFSKTVSLPLKPRNNDFGKSLESEMAKSRNRQSLMGQNNLANFPRSQNRNDFINQHAGFLLPAGYPVGFPLDAQKAWLSQLALNACGLSGIVNLNSGGPPEHQMLSFVPGKGFSSFGQTNNRSQNKRNYSHGKNPPKSGRPILSRSRATRPEEI